MSKPKDKASAQETPTGTEDFKAKGNECMKEKKFLEAVIHYTFAIKRDKNNAELLSNRSLALLKSQQFYLALSDASKVIQLKPSWVKGYYRKAEIYFHVKQYKKALEYYQRAKELQPEDATLADCIVKTKLEYHKENKLDFQIPWVGAGTGLLLGILAAMILAYQEHLILRNPLTQVVVAIVLSYAGYGLGKLYRWLIKSQQASFLENPGNIFGEDDDDAEEEIEKPVVNQKNKNRHKNKVS